MSTDQYRPAEQTPQPDAIMREMRKRSAATRASLPMTTISYDKQTGQTFDLFFPQAHWIPAPVHMFVCGMDYWRMSLKRDYSFIADTITTAGGIAAIVDHAHMPEFRMSILVDQVMRAKTWLLSNISEYNGDATRFTISGHSSGAHLAALSMAGAETTSGIRAALLLSGIYEFGPFEQFPARSQIGISDHDVAQFTPMTQVYDPSVAVVSVIGADEAEPSRTQRDRFARYLRNQGLKVRVEDLPGKGSMSSLRDLGVIDTETGNLLSELIKRS